MADLVAVPLANGGAVVVEMDHAPAAGVVKAGRPGEIVAKATRTLEDALESVTPAAQAIVAKLQSVQPDELTVEFGLTLTAEAGAVIARTASGCHLKVTLRWKPENDRAR